MCTQCVRRALARPRASRRIVLGQLGAHTQDLPDDPGHRLNALELGGGALLDLGIYPISFASDLFGTPETIQASATFKDTGADAQVATIFRYAGGQIATTLSASDTRGRNIATILGTDGRIDIMCMVTYHSSRATAVPTSCVATHVGCAAKRP